MPVKTKPVRTMSQDDHFRAIEILLAGILLKQNPTKKQVAKIMHIDDKELTEIFPERKGKKKESAKSSSDVQ